MKQGKNSETRAYRSDIRAAQAATTRRQILDAVVRVMAKGSAGPSIPAVASEAGVSIPTVYRHFGNKAGLMEALVPYVGERIGVGPDVAPRNLAELDDAVRFIFHRLDGADPLIRAALAAGSSPDARRHAVAVRMAALQTLFEGAEPPISAEAVERLAKLTVILTSSDALRLWGDRFDLGADEVADIVIWAIRTLIAGSRE